MTMTTTQIAITHIHTQKYKTATAVAANLIYKIERNWLKTPSTCTCWHFMTCEIEIESKPECGGSVVRRRFLSFTKAAAEREISPLKCVCVFVAYNWDCYINNISQIEIKSNKYFTMESFFTHFKVCKTKEEEEILQGLKF